MTVAQKEKNEADSRENWLAVKMVVHLAAGKVVAKDVYWADLKVVLLAGRMAAW